MDRRSWLWRKKSSEKIPGETESSGSISSHSESFSDDQVYATHNSTEIASKAAPNDEDTNNTIKSLKEKLSWAIQNLSAKEELVIQHAKVAEEAVAGWEAAENQVLGLKQQLHEDRVGHLDGALKECVRQLRQAREEQEQKINEAIAKKASEYESAKSELETQIMQLQAKLEASEEANSSLEQQLLSKAEELRIRMIETELCTQAAETASKQHLEDIRKVARLEAECKRLRVIAATDVKSFGPSSFYVESFTDSQSDYGERLFAGRNSMPHSMEIGLMDDFLEMERLAALPDTESESCYLEASPVSEQRTSCERALRSELEAIMHMTTEMEEKLEKMGDEKEELELSLRELHSQLSHTHESKVSIEEELKTSNMMRETAEEQLRIVEAEMEKLNSRIGSLEEELQKECALSAQSLAKCGDLEAKCCKLEGEVLGMKQGVELQQEKELAVAASKFAECQKTIASLGRQLKSLATLEEFLIDEKSAEINLRG